MFEDELTQPASPPMRVVLARPDRVGDVVITSSCFEPVKRALPGVELHFLAHSRMEPLFKGHPLLSGFIGLPKHERATDRMEALAVRLRRLAPQCIVHLHSDPEVEWAAAAAEIPRRIGFRRDGDKWLTDSLPDEKKRGEKHEGYYNFDLLALIGAPAPQKLVPRLSPETVAIERLHKKLPPGVLSHRYAVLHVGAHEGKPRLTPDFFIAAGRWLVSELRCYLILIGAEPDDPDIAHIIIGLGPAAAWTHNFCGQTDLAEAAWLLREAEIVFGRDSGPAHLAAAMGARTLSLMIEAEPANSARRWSPLGDRSWVLEKPLPRRILESKPGFVRRNLSQFTPEEVVSALHHALTA